MECYVDAGPIVKVRGVTPRDCVHLALAELGARAQSPVTVHLPIGDDQVFILEDGAPAGTIAEQRAAREEAEAEEAEAWEMEIASAEELLPERLDADREADRLALEGREMVCLGCGCTDSRACPGGCFWVRPYLCSKCAEANL